MSKFFTYIYFLQSSFILKIKLDGSFTNYDKYVETSSHRELMLSLESFRRFKKAKYSLSSILNTIRDGVLCSHLHL